MLDDALEKHIQTLRNRRGMKSEKRARDEERSEKINIAFNKNKMGIYLHCINFVSDNKSRGIMYGHSKL